VCVLVTVPLCLCLSVCVLRVVSALGLQNRDREQFLSTIIRTAQAADAPLLRLWIFGRCATRSAQHPQ
jgi:hypothetical protein